MFRWIKSKWHTSIKWHTATRVDWLEYWDWGESEHSYVQCECGARW